MMSILKSSIFKTDFENIIRETEWCLPKIIVFEGFEILQEEEQTHWQLAEIYRESADEIVELVYADRIEDFKFRKPILYLYRHAIELYLKDVIVSTKAPLPSKLDLDNCHNLHKLANVIPSMDKAVKTRIQEIHMIDPSSTALRYPGAAGKDIMGGVYCDIRQLQRVITAIREYLLDLKNLPSSLGQ